MKKLLTVLLSLMLVVGTVLAFVSCGGQTTCTAHVDNNGDGICDTEGCGAAVEVKPDANSDAFNENGELILFKDGAPTFQFVLGSDAVSEQMEAITELAKTLEGLSVKGSKINTVTQNEGDAKTVEILIGTVTNRGNEYNVNKYDYGNTGYVVKQIGTKIIVTGGSDKAISNAVSHLKTKVFGIKKNNENFGDFVMTADKAYDVKQSNYSLKEITVANNSIRDYVIAYPASDTASKSNAEELQTLLYDKCGIYLEISIDSKVDAGKKLVLFRTITNDGKGDGFYVKVDENANLVIECEFKTKSTEIAKNYFNNNVFNKKGTFAYEAAYNYSENHRDIYYKNFGAKGDGKTDDFAALAAAHEAANLDLLNVHAEPGATYYIGNENKNNSIIVKTNTYFHGCNFIFDDQTVDFKSSGRTAPIFKIVPDTEKKTYTRSNSPVRSLEKGATNVGWAPGKTAMIVVYNDEIRHYIRYGTNADGGKPQHELILIDAEGNVDPSTPIQWTYEIITSMELYNVDDRPIEIRGEDENGNKAVVTTYHNDGPNTYWYYARNFDVTRSNVVLSGIEHVYDRYVPHSDGGTGCPYDGFVQLTTCNNVTIENFTYESAPRYRDDEPERANRPTSMPTLTNGTMGTYEISAELANNITWKNSDQSNFFKPDGTLNANGLTGTNFCKNLVFDTMYVTTFDAHCGVYNGTIINSTIMRANYIGSGEIKLKDVTVYADGDTRSVIDLRDDYGSTWDGNVDIDGLHIKIKKITPEEQNKFNNQGGLRIFNGNHSNHFFGYTTYLPENIVLRNVLIEEYTLTLENGARKEIHSAYNNYKIRLFAKEINDATYDFYRDKMFGGEANKNPMVPTKKIEFYTEYTGKYAELGIKTKLDLAFPNKTHSGGSTMFRDTEYWIDGVLQD